MDGQERLSALVDALRRDGRVDVAEAAVRFGTAELTIRRDLDVLVTRGVARRVRGGALNLLMRGEELPFAMRELDGVEAKRRIAATVAAMITDGEAVGLDSGTTVLEVARALAGRRLTLLPLSLPAATATAGGDARLIMPAGEVRGGELALTGAGTLASIAGLRLDTVVLGSCGVSSDGQVMAHDLDDAAVKRALITSGRRRVLAVHAGKFGVEAMAVVGPLTDYDVIVTDAGADVLPAPHGVEVVRV